MNRGIIKAANDSIDDYVDILIKAVPDGVKPLWRDAYLEGLLKIKERTLTIREVI